MSTGYLVFARLDSARLPGKALTDLGGRPLLGRVLDRLRLAAGTRPVIVATSDRPVDDPIAAFATADGAPVFRGDCDDVAGRALAAARRFGLERFVRISGDSPFMDPALCRLMVDLAETGDDDVVTNVFPRGWPPGCSVEIIRTAAMERAVAAMTDAHDHEHVTPYFYRHADRFRICNVPPPEALPLVPLTLDTAGDLKVVRAMMSMAGPKPEAVDIVTLIDIALKCRAREC
ncbi:NTP transferase domain-containing protein [Magnetospirillum sp. 15-1]|uniref:cytidylyltransferase domain-containing protein n=1 Tax=Magnetospirillum sp. 15-1 TaxID=1979370 RepID=UPI00148291BF|nr:NTP transferase domain-containing protein [Magnetospirillum sp. 15-1]